MGPVAVASQLCITTWQPSRRTIYFKRKDATDTLKHKEFTIKHLDEAACNYRKDTLGIDAMKCSELRQLPLCSRDSTSSDINKLLSTAALPHQLLISLNPCLGKPGGGCSTTSKTPMIYRMTIRADTTVMQWESANMDSYDIAQVGSSALRAAFTICFRAELTS